MDCYHETVVERRAVEGRDGAGGRNEAGDGVKSSRGVRDGAADRNELGGWSEGQKGAGMKEGGRMVQW